MLPVRQLDMLVFGMQWKKVPSNLFTLMLFNVGNADEWHGACRGTLETIILFWMRWAVSHRISRFLHSDPGKRRALRRFGERQTVSCAADEFSPDVLSQNQH